jgi:HSP20 family protein
MLGTNALDPWRALETIGQEFDRLLSRRSRGTDGAEVIRASMAGEEREDGYYLAFDMPGVALDRLQIEAQERILRIRGERGAPDEPFYFAYERVLALPPTSTEGIEANLRDGVLYLKVPKRQQAGPRRIEVQGSSAQPTAADGQERIDSESQGLHETDGLRGSGSPPDYFGRPDKAERDREAGVA